MQTRITSEEIEAAARQLARSEAGRRGLRQLVEILHDDDVRHGLLDRAALSTLLQGAWDGHAAEVRETIRQVLSEETGHAQP